MKGLHKKELDSRFRGNDGGGREGWHGPHPALRATLSHLPTGEGKKGAGLPAARQPHAKPNWRGLWDAFGPPVSLGFCVLSVYLAFWLAVGP